MRSKSRTFYRYRAFDLRTLDSLCRDTLHFASPSEFNDPLDSRPTLKCDSSVADLRALLEHLVKERVVSEVNASLQRLRIKGERADLYASKNAESEARRALANIAYHATNPDYDDPGQAEEWLLTREIERELLRHYERGVCCFSADYKSPLLWSHYGDQHRGLCIGYVTDRVPKPRLQRVKYGGDRSIGTSLLIQAFCLQNQRSKQLLDQSVLLRKAKDWSYEKEWRLVDKTGTQESPLLLTEVVFGLRCPDSVKYSVVKAITSVGRKVSFYEIGETMNRYSLVRSELDMPELQMYFPHVAVSGVEVFGKKVKRAKKKRSASVA